ncbi:unnamed protein product, partial [Hapterophycus canaliculatus]
CATSFGDFVATRLGLHDWPSGTYALVIAVFALASVVVFVAAQHVVHLCCGEKGIILEPATVRKREARPVSPAEKAASPPAPTVEGGGGGGDGSARGSGVHGVDGGEDGSGVGGVGCGGGSDGGGSDAEGVGNLIERDAAVDVGRGSGPSIAGRISSVRSSSAIFNRVSKGKKAFAILAQQEEQQRAASLMTTAAIIEAELEKQRFASVDGIPAGAYNRTSSGSFFCGHKLKWPVFATPGRSRQRAVHTQFPDSSHGSSRSHSLKSSPRPISESGFPDDGPSPPPLTPGKASTKITAETLARGLETSRSPHTFARGLGGWWAETSDGGFEGRSSLRLAGTGGGGGRVGGDDAAGRVSGEGACDPGQKDGG